MSPALPLQLHRWLSEAFRPVCLWLARKKLRQALDRYHGGRYADACTACEAALQIYPDYAEASYVLGVLAFVGDAPELAASSFEHALRRVSDYPAYAAALADTMLLRQREEEALSLYRRAFPALAEHMAELIDAGAPWKRVHPDWLTRCKRVTLPTVPRSISDTRVLSCTKLRRETATHLLNWAVLLLCRRQASAAMFLLEHAVKANPALGDAHAVLALVQTLNLDWQPALASAKAARKLGAEAFQGSTDLCVLAAQFGLRYSFSELDSVFDWSAFHRLEEGDGDLLHQLSPCSGNTHPRFAHGRLVYLICCDTDYLLMHAIALVCSIREHETFGAIHLHIFNPRTEAWDAIQRLEQAVSPVCLTTSWEWVDFDRYGGKALYCACARFVRLYQFVSQVDNRFVMLDADSLLRADLSRAVAEDIQIGLVRAPDEPIWHRYLAGFTAFRRSPAALAFLRDLGAFIGNNLITGHGRTYLDQIGLFASVYRHASLRDAITQLPIRKFCDTLLRDEGLVWSVTQRKDDGRYNAYKQAVLARYDA
jgi:tetratricopeptide (TPR) repeat protein